MVDDLKHSYDLFKFGDLVTLSLSYHHVDERKWLAIWLGPTMIGAKMYWRYLRLHDNTTCATGSPDMFVRVSQIEKALG